MSMEDFGLDGMEFTVLQHQDSLELLETEHNQKFNNVRSPSMVKKKLRREENDLMSPPSHRTSGSGDYSDVKSVVSIDEAIKELEAKGLKSILKPPEKGYSDIYRSHCKESIRDLMMETKKYTNHYNKKLSRSV